MLKTDFLPWGKRRQAGRFFCVFI